MTREMKYSSIKRGFRIIRVRVKRVKMAEKWGEIQGTFDIVPVSGEFELPGFYYMSHFLRSIPLFPLTSQSGIGTP